MSRPVHEPKHLLDTPAEQNIGNGVIIQPQAGGATVVPQTNPDRILMLSGPSGSAQTTSIALTASRIVGPNNPNPGFPGPITAVIEFGNGGQFTKVEVDIPLGPFAGFFNQLSQSIEPQDGGTIVTVPTGVLRVYARYDNQLIQPILTLPPASLAQLAGVPFIGPGGPVTRAARTAPSEPVQVRAMAAYYSRHTSKVYRTHYCYVGDASIPTGAVTSVPVIQAHYCVPAFARSLKVLRYLTGSPATLPGLDIALYDNAYNIMDLISIPVGTASPIIPIIGTETIVQIQSHVPATDKVSLLALCYEIGI